MKRAQYVKMRARRLAEEEGIPYREALREEGRRVTGIRQATDAEITYFARNGKPKPPTFEPYPHEIDEQGSDA